MRSILPLILEEVVYRVGREPLIDRVNSRFTAGTKTVILGYNGAGKSLLLRLCHGLIRPTSGIVRWEGSRAADAARHQAMVFQRPVVLRRSVAANIRYVLRIHKIPHQDREERLAEALQLAGLAHLAKRPAPVLSGGEQQRLALARAWAIRPEVTFLDEPTAHLDPAATAAFEAMIETIHGRGAKVIMTTHDLAQARRVADEICFIHKGRLLETTPAARFFEDPQSPEGRAFLKGELIS